MIKCTQKCLHPRERIKNKKIFGNEIYLFIFAPKFNQLNYFIMKSTIQITAQYEENYGAHNWNGEGICPQYWKPKGGQIFSLEIDLDYLYYTEEQCISVFNTMLEKLSNNFERYSYIDHEVIYSKPIELDSDDFEKLFTTECEKTFN